MAQMVEHLPVMRETWVQYLGREDPLEKEMATHSSIHEVFMPGKSHGLRSLVGYGPWGRKESDTTEQLHFTSLQVNYNYDDDFSPPAPPDYKESLSLSILQWLALSGIQNALLRREYCSANG